MGNLHASLRRAHSDQSGAVMVTGVFLASFLVGALWYLMGIGDAIVFRGRMQEAADHAAFTSAALHAKGMNFIAACNLVMLALVFVHIVLGIIHDFALVCCVLSLGSGCGGFLQARRAYESWASFFKPMLSTLHELEGAAAVGYPYVGAWKAYEIGRAYERTSRRTGPVIALAISPSMIPSDEGMGLPVRSRRYDSLCERLGNRLYDETKRHVSLPGLGLVGSVVNEITGGDDPEELARKIIGKVLTFRYCNALGAKGASSTYKNELAGAESKIDGSNMFAELHRGAGGRTKAQRPYQGSRSYAGGWNQTLDPGFDTGWGNDGPRVPKVGNGNDAYRVWSVVSASSIDRDLARVHVASRTHGTLAIDPAVYVAEAELYYDCTERWSDDACNGRGEADDNAAYAIRWRARLRRFELEPLGRTLAAFRLEDAARDPHIPDEALENGPAGVRSSARALDGALQALETWRRTRTIDGARSFH